MHATYVYHPTDSPPPTLIPTNSLLRTRKNSSPCTCTRTRTDLSPPIYTRTQINSLPCTLIPTKLLPHTCIPIDLLPRPCTWTISLPHTLIPTNLPPHTCTPTNSPPPTLTTALHARKTRARHFTMVPWQTNAGRLAVHLAQFHFFGTEVMQRCIAGTLDQKKMSLIKEAILSKYPNRCRQDKETLWERCRKAIGQKCNHLRYKKWLPTGLLWTLPHTLIPDWLTHHHAPPTHPPTDCTCTNSPLPPTHPPTDWTNPPTHPPTYPFTDCNSPLPTHPPTDCTCRPTHPPTHPYPAPPLDCNLYYLCLYLHNMYIVIWLSTAHLFMFVFAPPFQVWCAADDWFTISTKTWHSLHNNNYNVRQQVRTSQN